MNRPAPIAAYVPTQPRMLIVIDRTNGHVFRTDAEGENHARMLAESLVDNGQGWRATIIDNDANVVATYKGGALDC